MSKLENKASADYTINGYQRFSVASNTVEFHKLDDELKLHKSVHPTTGAAGDKVVFSIDAVTTYPISGVAVTDKLAGFTFVPGSVKIDNVPVTMADPNVGIELGNRYIGLTTPATYNITFDCTVD